MDTNAIMLLRCALVFPICWKRTCIIHTYIHTYMCASTYTLYMETYCILEGFVVHVAWRPVAQCLPLTLGGQFPSCLQHHVPSTNEDIRCAVSRMPVVSSVAVERCWVMFRCTRWPVLQGICTVNVQVQARRRWKTIQNFLCVPSCAATSIIFVVATCLHPAMSANTCRIISVTPLTSSLADLPVQNTFHLLRRSASWHAVYIWSRLLLLHRTTWSIDKEIVLLPSAVYRSYSRAAVLPHFGVTIQSGTGLH